MHVNRSLEFTRTSFWGDSLRARQSPFKSPRHRQFTQNFTPSAAQSKDPYRVLQVTPGSSLSDIKAAYYEKIKLLHPDVNEEDTTEEAVGLNIAYATLLQGTLIKLCLFWDQKSWLFKFIGCLSVFQDSNQSKINDICVLKPILQSTRDQTAVNFKASQMSLISLKLKQPSSLSTHSYATMLIHFSGRRFKRWQGMRRRKKGIQKKF